jgi:hypothetical protein
MGQSKPGVGFLSGSNNDSINMVPFARRLERG